MAKTQNLIDQNIRLRRQRDKLALIAACLLEHLNGNVDIPFGTQRLAKLRQAQIRVSEADALGCVNIRFEEEKEQVTLD